MDEEYVPKMKTPDEFLGYYTTIMRSTADNELYRMLFKCFRTSNKYGNYNRHFYYAVPVSFKKTYTKANALPKKRKYNLTGIQPPEYGEFRLVEDVEGYNNPSFSKVIDKIGRSGRIGPTGVFTESSNYDRDTDIHNLKMFKNEIAEDQENMEF